MKSQYINQTIKSSKIHIKNLQHIATKTVCHSDPLLRHRGDETESCGRCPSLGIIRAAPCRYLHPSPALGSPPEGGNHHRSRCTVFPCPRADMPIE